MIPPEAAHFSFGKVTALGTCAVLLYLVVYLTLLSSFLCMYVYVPCLQKATSISLLITLHSSLVTITYIQCTCTYIHVTMHVHHVHVTALGTCAVLLCLVCLFDLACFFLVHVYVPCLQKATNMSSVESTAMCPRERGSVRITSLCLRAFFPVSGSSVYCLHTHVHVYTSCTVHHAIQKTSYTIHYVHVYNMYTCMHRVQEGSKVS